MRPRCLLRAPSLCALLLAACHPADDTADAAVRSDASSALPADGGEAGPLVRVLSPEGAADPSSGAIVADDVEVRCEVKPRSEGQRINPASVGIRVYSGDGDTASVSAQARFEADDVFASTVSLKDLPPGAVRFVCSGSDTRSPAGVASGEVETFLDHGPQIEIETPAEGSAIARGDQLLIRYRVSPAPLAERDTNAELAEATLRVQGVVREPEREADGSYSLRVSLDERDFPRTETELGIEVTASNTRLPEPAIRRLVRTVVVDGEGPAIEVLSPKEASFVGKRADIEVRIRDDGAGIRPGSARVTVTVEGETDVMELIPSAQANEPDIYRATLEVGKYRERAQLTLNVIAEDQAGNETRSARLVFVDSVPPWVSLDPPLVRGYTRAPSSTGLECSAPFDLVGNAVSDSDRSSFFAIFRALVWERGITMSGQSIENVSNVEPGSVAFFVQGRADVPLIVDRDGDGVCDEIAQNPDASHPELAPAKVGLSQIRHQGYLLGGVSSLASDAPATAGFCALSPARGTVNPLCGTGTMTYIARHGAKALGSVIYGVAPAMPTYAGCTGFDWQATVNSGWVCVAATAADTLRNVGFSRPLRVCYGSDVLSADCPEPAPSCTDGCTLPDYVAEQGMPRFIDATP